MGDIIKIHHFGTGQVQEIERAAGSTSELALLLQTQLQEKTTELQQLQLELQTTKQENDVRGSSRDRPGLCATDNKFNFCYQKPLI